jgi:hypothetical protein
VIGPPLAWHVLSDLLQATALASIFSEWMIAGFS